MRLHHAEFIAEFIKFVFLSAELLGEGIEASWKLGGHHTTDIALNQWTIFQETFTTQWPAFVAANTSDDFWIHNQPAFHAYDYGSNVEIDVSPQITLLPALTRLRAMEEPSSNEELNSSEDEDARVRLHRQSTEQNHTDPNFEPYHVGLTSLQRELEAKYKLECIDTISYALAVDFHCMEKLPNAAEDDDDDLWPRRCLLTDRKKVAGEYNDGANSFTFYPMGFHPRYGNFSSPEPPNFLKNNVTAILEDNLSFQNYGAAVLSSAYFQAYSNIKKSVRHSPDDLLATKGYATAALTLPENEAKCSGVMARKRNRLLQRVRGELTPDDPGSSKPFAREGQRVDVAIAASEYALRMEQVLSIRVSRLIPARRTFTTILRPIQHLMRFYMVEKEAYMPIMRSFDPNIFPGVLRSFAKVFELAIDYIHTCHQMGGSRLPVALAEAVSALDRLGNYCFTGNPRTLMRSVLTKLQTLRFMEQGAWPFIDPNVLNIRACEHHRLSQWPCGSDGRPILMHVASIAFHYGRAAAAARQSNVWFQEIGTSGIYGVGSAEFFLYALFRDTFVPETVAFVLHQHRRQRNQSNALSAEEHTQVAHWSEVEEPFTLAYVSSCLFIHG
jgi:hypothetical protein